LAPTAPEERLVLPARDGDDWHGFVPVVGRRIIETGATYRHR